jgi:D-alanine-D-alanine ligase
MNFFVKKLEITILYDAVEDVDKKEAEAAGEKVPPLVCEQVEHVLAKQGHEVKRLAAEHKIRDLASQIMKDDSDLIFNLCESLGGVSQFEQHVAALLEVLEKKFTGAGSIGLTLAQDKELSKKIFQFHGIRYPKFSVMDAGKVGWSDELSFPLFVKPLNEDASIGIDSGSIIHNVKELMERISYIQTEFNAPALIEEYIEGRELYIGVLGNDKPEALPILEWDFSKMPKGTPRIASSEAKWDEESAYKDAPEVFPADIPEAVYMKIQETAIQAFKSLKLRDYGRVDMRLRHAVKDIETKSTEQEANFDNWEFYVIEVNPNPYLDKKSELAMAARKHELNYPDLIEKIIELAMERKP